AQYFNLPAPSASTWQLSDVHQKMLFENVFSNQPLQQADEFAAITTARHLALYEQEPQKLEAYLTQVQSSFDVLPDELSLWLGVLHFKLGN
ncbi:hypothetical protein OFC58_31270, partial [Escherichia coli]|nr:hypothetical protein [Escherichia coli]